MTCACGCGQSVPRTRAVYANRAHMIEYWIRTGKKRAAAVIGARHAARVHRRKAFQKALAVTGLTLTDRELLLYKRAYLAGYQAGHMRGKYHGERKGWAAAMGGRTRRAE